MKPIIFVLCFLLGSLAARAQEAPVSNVKIRVSEAQDMVTITYNLARNSRITYYNISTKISLAGRPLPNPTGLSGDVGNQITAGLGKKIIWNALQDVTSLEGELKVEVVSNTTVNGGEAGPCTPLKTIPAYAGIGGVALTGLGLIISGLSQKGQSNDLYAVYETNLNPNDGVYASLSRDEYYREANSKHKSGTWLTVAGGATLVAGGFAMVSRLLKINAYNRQCEQGQSVSWKEPRLRLEPSTASGPGVALVYKF